MIQLVHSTQAIVTTPEAVATDGSLCGPGVCALQQTVAT